MNHYMIAIKAEVSSSLSKEDLESKLVASLFDLETGVQLNDGDTKQLEVVDYELTEAIPITN